MGDGIVDGDINFGSDRGRRKLFVGNAELVGSEIDLVELRERIAHRSVAPLANVDENVTDRGTQVGFKDVIKTAMHQRCASLVAHFGPRLSSHHLHKLNGTQLSAQILAELSSVLDPTEQLMPSLWVSCPPPCSESTSEQRHRVLDADRLPDGCFAAVLVVR